MPSIEEKITKYIEGLSPSILSLEDTGTIEILEMIPGSYNLNFHIRVDQKDFIFRVNIEQQSGLANQIEHEFSRTQLFYRNLPRFEWEKSGLSHRKGQYQRAFDITALDTLGGNDAVKFKSSTHFT